MRYQPSLDGLRTIAVAGVVAVHLGLPYCAGAGMGVEIFFVLSGYLITRLLLAEEVRFGGIDLGRFYARRLLRLYPALLAMTAFTLAAVRMLPADTLYQARPSFQPTAAAFAVSYLMNFNRAFGWTEPGLFAHTWSLAIEEQFYLAWPLFLWVTRGRDRVGITAAIIVAICLWRGFLLLHGASVTRVYNGIDTHSDALLIGCLLGMVHARIAARWQALFSRTVWIPLALVLIDFRYMPAGTPWGQGVGMIAIELVAAWLIAALAALSLANRLLSSAPMVWLGRRSYGIYLWHYPMIGLSGSLNLTHQRPAVVAATLFASGLSFRLVEAPFLRLKHRLARVEPMGGNEPALQP